MAKTEEAKKEPETVDDLFTVVDEMSDEEFEEWLKGATCEKDEK